MDRYTRITTAALGTRSEPILRTCKFNYWRRGWRRGKTPKWRERCERKRSVMGGHARVWVLSKLACLSLKKNAPLLCKEAPEQIFGPLWKYVFQRLYREMEISSSAATAKGRRDNFGLPWSS